MGISVETLAVAKKYTNRSIEGIAGSLAGKNATIESITDITGGHRVTFKWTADNGDVRTQSMDVMDGADGQDGKGIKSVTVNSSNHLIITYDDDTTVDAGEIDIHSAVNSVNGKKGDVDLTASDVGALPDDTELFSGDYNDLDNLPDLTNFITNTVDNLVNYYKKTETYTKTEVDNIANTIKNGRFEAVAALPTTDIKTNVIYLVPKPDAQTQNAKDEYINLDGTSAGWEKIGDTEIDLSGYVTTTALNTALAAYTTTTDLTALLADKVDKVTGKGLSTNDYANTDKELVDSIPTLAPISLVKDTVGWTGKNLLKNTATSRTIDGVTFTVNADKSVTVNGTGTNPNAGVRELNQHFTLPAGNYILSGSPHNVYSDTGFKLQIYNWTDSIEVVTCNTDEDAHFAIGENKDIAVRIWFRGTPSTSGEDVTFYPMIRRADIIDDTYEPYHESVEEEIEQIYADSGVLGAKNLLKNTATSQTINGVTFTVNADGSITANGTATDGTSLILSTNVSYNAGDYILTADNDGDGGIDVSRIYLTMQIGSINYDVTRNQSAVRTHQTTPFTVVSFRFFISSGITANNLTIYPMLRLASDPDDTYQPYAMTNRELTDKTKDVAVTEVKSSLDSTYVSSCSSFRYLVKNGICFVYINNIKFTNASVGVTDCIILPNGILPKASIPATSMLWATEDAPLLVGIMRDSDGNVKISINGITSSNVNHTWYGGNLIYPIV